MQNYIWINHTKKRVLTQLNLEDASGVFLRWDTGDTNKLRNYLKRVEAVAAESSVPRVMVIDGRDLKPKMFVLFLKLLENPGGNMYVSFIGAKINHYPLTIRSRCTVRVLLSEDADEALKEELSERGKADFYRDVLALRHYDVDVALKMLELKPKFTDMLVRLEHFKPERYSDIIPFQKQPIEFLFLFYEWFNRNKGLFNLVDLDRCMFLRERDVLEMLRDLSICDVTFETYIFDLLFVRKALLNAT